MKLPKELTTVTPLSKILAAVFFIAFPFISFFLGMQYQYMTDLYNQQLADESILSPQRKLTPTPNRNAQWKQYKNSSLGIEFSYPEKHTIIKETANSISLGINQEPLFTVTVNKLNNYSNLKSCSPEGPNLNGYPCLCQGTIPGPNNDPLELQIKEFESELYCVDEKSNQTSFDILQIKSSPTVELKMSGDVGNGAGIEIFDQILQTFKFTDQNPTPTVGAEGKFCGGIAGNLPENTCPSGYYCKLDGDYPDAAGKCVKK